MNPDNPIDMTRMTGRPSSEEPNLQLVQETRIQRVFEVHPILLIWVTANDHVQRKRSREIGTINVGSPSMKLIYIPPGNLYRVGDDDLILVHFLVFAK